jgi:hypothetical protein
MQTRGRSTQPVPGAASDSRRRTVATFTDYASAERAVDYLSDHGFPVDRTAIVARDLKLVEQVTGRMGYLEAALRGLLSGAVTGVLADRYEVVADEEVADEAERLIRQIPGASA